MSISQRTTSLDNYFEKEFQEKLLVRYVKQTGRPPAVLPPHIKLIEINESDDKDVEGVVNDPDVTAPVIDNIHIYVNNGFEC